MNHSESLRQAGIASRLSDRASFMVMAALVIFMRFLHIASALTLVGGAAAWAFAGRPAAAASGDARTRVENAFAAAWRPFAIAGILGILISGIFNFLRKTGLP